MRPTAFAALLVLALTTVLVTAGCGMSQESRATKSVCDARADISTQVEALKGLTVSTATTNQIRASLTAIRADLSTIANAQKDLTGQRKQQIQAANQAFASEVKSIAADLGSSLSLESATQQLAAALQQLGSSYEKNLGRIDCSG
jgi:uncharacterized protein YhaN